MKIIGKITLIALVIQMALLLPACDDDGDDDKNTAMSVAITQPTTATQLPAMTTSQTLSTIMESPANLSGHNIYRPANMNATGAPLPVVVWANGGCVRTDRPWQILFERWAGAGFFVITIAGMPEVGSDGQPASTLSNADDQKVAIDWAIKENESSGGPYAGQLDITRIVAAGNSCGGITSLVLAAQDSRVTSVFVLSGSSVGPGSKREQAEAVMSKISVPVGFAVGGPEDIASDQADQDYDLLAPGLPGMVASRASGDHPTVSTDPTMLSEVAEIGLHWMKLTLYGSEEAKQALTGNPCSKCEPGLWSIKTKNLP